VVDRVKICLTSSLITMQNLVAFSHTVCAHVGDHKNLGMLGPRPLGMGAWLTPRNMLLPTRVTVPNSLILSHTVRA